MLKNEYRGLRVTSDPEDTKAPSEPYIPQITIPQIKQQEAELIESIFGEPSNLPERLTPSREQDILDFLNRATRNRTSCFCRGQLPFAPK